MLQSAKEEFKPSSLPHSSSIASRCNPPKRNLNLFILPSRMSRTRLQSAKEEFKLLISCVPLRSTTGCNPPKRNLNSSMVSDAGFAGYWLQSAKEEFKLRTNFVSTTPHIWLQSAKEEFKLFPFHNLCIFLSFVAIRQRGI